MVITNRNVELKISIKEAFIITVLSWILLAVLSAVPFIYTKVNLSVVDALFESMSGITTTGSTVINNLDYLPKGILIWRAIFNGWVNWCCSYSINYSTVSKSWWNATFSFRGR